MYFGKKQITAFATFKSELQVEELQLEVVENGEHSIEAPEGTAYKKVSASVNVPVPEKQELSVDIAENGEFVNNAPDGKAYNKVTVNVNVPSKEEQSKSVELDFSAGDMSVTPDDGKVLSAVTIAKPATLLPENIAEGVEIAGVVGTHVGGGGAAADVRYVTFMNGNEVLYVKPVAVGDDCADIIARGLIDTPTKESTAQYNYTFYGWGASDGGAADANILKNITEDKTVYAIYTATTRLYTITWLDSDGTTALKTEQVAYGAVPSYTPSKEGVSFSGWTPTPVAVIGDASYTAKWIEKVVFATGSWADIARIAESGEAANHFAIGDTRNIQIGDYSIPFMIAGFNHDELSDGSGKAGISLVATELYPVLYDKGYGYCDRFGEIPPCEKINALLDSVADEALRSVIKSVTKASEESSSGQATITDCDCYIWVPSMIELGPTTNVYSTNQYNLLGSTYEAFTAARDMRRKLAGSADYAQYFVRNCGTALYASWTFYQRPASTTDGILFRRAGSSDASNQRYPLLGFCI